MNLLVIYKRKPLTDLQRAQMFRDHKGICCICDLKIGVTEKWWDEHERALALGGTNNPENRGPAHVKCAKIKTKDDMGMINKAKRQEAKYIGAKRSKHKWPKRTFGN